MERLWDAFFALYFIIHIPILVLFDAQVVLPSWLFPDVLRNMTAEYGRVIKDSMVLKPPAWYKSLCVCEITFQAPLIFLCTYAFVLGGRRWIRIPAIIYGTHVATTLIPILAHIGYHDFTGETPQGPETLDDRLKVAGIYLPWFVWPALLVWRMCVSPFYSGQASATNKRKAH